MKGREIEVLFAKETIDRRVAEMAREIEADFMDGELVVVGVLKGSFVFMADLVRAIKRPLSCDFIRVSSYEHDKDTGVVRMEFDMTQPIGGKNVLLVEDIVDSGKTLRHLRRHIEAKDPAKMKVATLLYKGTPTNSRTLVDYVGFDSPHKYVIGYGLDSEGLYRSLPYVGAFK
ncbi:MAG TPA: hypoxanthine phosphoribosyltransferase [bacterium]|nr:hypoxanthine phosphoribosyltransferase [bacterium]